MVLVLRHGVADARKLEKLLPMLVALRGRVDSTDPKKCELSERKCVIHEVRDTLECTSVCRRPWHSNITA